jgi:hypothetical protein
VCRVECLYVLRSQHHNLDLRGYAVGFPPKTSANGLIGVCKLDLLQNATRSTVEDKEKVGHGTSLTVRWSSENLEELLT